MNQRELAELDLAVAKAEGMEAVITQDGLCWSRSLGRIYQPTLEDSETLRLIEKYRLALMPVASGWHGWVCYQPTDPLNDLAAQIFGEGAPTGIAVCRAVVALKAAG